jgi:hypothetical protein
MVIRGGLTSYKIRLVPSEYKITVPAIPLSPKTLINTLHIRHVLV